MNMTKLSRSMLKTIQSFHLSFLFFFLIVLTQVLTLEDGTKALIKAVESEADGSIVYHISCVDNNFAPHSNNEMESSVPASYDKSEIQSNSGL